jgi:hypothetical protein
MYAKLLFPDLKAYLHELKKSWEVKHDEVAKFVELHLNSMSAKKESIFTKEPKRKRRRKEKVKKEEEEDSLENFDCYAAELEVEFFVKVCQSLCQKSINFMINKN